MMRLIIAAVFLLAPSSQNLRATIGYTRFIYPGADYAIEHPADWKLSYGLQLINLRPTDKDEEGIRITLQRFPVIRSDPKTPKECMDRVLAHAGRINRVKSRRQVIIGGRKAERVELIDIVSLKGEYGQTLPGPLEETYQIIPMGKFYYVLSLHGVGTAYRKAAPDFERITQSLRFNVDSPTKPRKP